MSDAEEVSQRLRAPPLDRARAHPRRLRLGLFLARLPEAVPVPSHQDRPHLRARPARRRRQRRDRGRDPGHGPEPGPRRGGRGGGERGAAPLPRRSAAAVPSRATTSARPWNPPRPRLSSTLTDPRTGGADLDKERTRSHEKESVIGPRASRNAWAYEIAGLTKCLDSHPSSALERGAEDGGNARTHIPSSATATRCGRRSVRKTWLAAGLDHRVHDGQELVRGEGLVDVHDGARTRSLPPGPRLRPWRSGRSPGCP